MRPVQFSFRKNYGKKAQSKMVLTFAELFEEKMFGSNKQSNKESAPKTLFSQNAEKCRYAGQR
jgi:hypothetical protein